MLMWTEISRFINGLNKPIPATSLAIFRFLFGLLMALSMLRFVSNGWVQSMYIDPSFHFSYYGLDWVKPIGIYTYAIFAICFISSVTVALGYRYRWSCLVFTLSFLYIEGMDKTTYLNHYYFISVMGLLLLLLPAQRAYSIDALRGRVSSNHIPLWSLRAPQLLVCLVYFYAGLSKLNSDWLIHAQPLATWLPGKTDVPIIGVFFETSWVHYLFSWGGAIYDLSIPFLLIFSRTRSVAFLLVIGFHVLTRILFPIGMFPYIMIVGAMLFFPSSSYDRLLNRFEVLYGRHSKSPFLKPSNYRLKLSKYIVGVILCLQILLPWRYLCYPGELFWTEQGFRFSWRVMLMEKQGYTVFRIIDTKTNKSWIAQNSKFLTPFQEKQMSFQPDMILEYAYFLEKYYCSKEGFSDLEVYADSFVALNGRPSQRFIDPTIDLTTLTKNDYRIKWLLPFKDDIQGI